MEYNSNHLLQLILIEVYTIIYTTYICLSSGRQIELMFVCLSKSVRVGTHASPLTTHEPFQAYTKAQVWIASIG